MTLVSEDGLPTPSHTVLPEVSTGFGTFSITKRRARTGRNPQTGKEIKIPSTRVAKFKAGNLLKSAVK